MKRSKNNGQFAMKSFLSGGLAGSVTATLVYPLDFLRTRLGADVHKNKS